MPRSLQDQVVVITGGGRGIGLATASHLVAAGAKVAIGDLDDDVAAKAALQVGGGTIGLTVDVSDRASYAAFVERATAELGPVDVLVNNAGIMPLSALVDESDDATDRILDVNLRGVITGTKLVLPGMIERGHGHVVNVASAVGRIAAPHGATYSASKFGVVGFSEAMRAEVRPHGVAVSTVLPGVVSTELSVGVGQARGVKPVTPDQVARTVVRVARGKGAEVWVPAYAQHMLNLFAPLPRSVKEGINRAFRADKVLSDIDVEARSAYEQRIAPPRP